MLLTPTGTGTGVETDPSAPTDHDDLPRRHGFPPMTPTAPYIAAVPRDSFLDACRAAELFNPSQLAKAEAAIPVDVPTPAAAAKALVAAGLLTKFQAERLLAGKTDGFHLGQYTVLEQVGRGAMGRVYKARHRTMNRSVAVKVLSADLTRTQAARQAFQREVRAAAQLNHRNIVTAYDANEVADRFYLVLEFVDGPNLDTLVRERGPLPVAEVCELGRQIAEGLEHAHDRGMVHRDIKPANVLVARPSKSIPEHLVKIADFGIAKLSPTQTPSPGMAWLGTPDYVAPEQAQNPARVDSRADLYSLGAVLYFLLTGHPPFPGGTAEEKVRRHLREEPRWLDHLRPDAPLQLVSLVHRLLAKRPDDRPKSATEVAGVLESVQGSAAEAVSFDLPPVHGGQYSFVGGQLSGGYAVPMAEAVSETDVELASGTHPAALAETSPWEQITGKNPAVVIPPVEPAPRRVVRAGKSSWFTGGVVFGILLVCATAIGVMVKLLGK